MKSRIHHRAILITALAAAITPAKAAPGSLDTSFNGNGIITTDLGGSTYASAVAAGPDGKIVTVGTVSTEGGRNLAVLRFNANGTPDTSFGSDGQVFTDVLESSNDYATAVAVQEDGKIVVGGYTDANEKNDFLVVRYQTDGTLDPSFGSGGAVITPISSSTDRGAALVIQSDGKIILAGSSSLNSNANFALLRLNPNGTPDTTFDTDGILELSFQGNDLAQAVTLQPDGKIVVAGYTGPAFINSVAARVSESAQHDFAVARVNPNGTLDTTFDTDGKQTTDFGNDDRASGVAIQSDGKIVVAGTWDGGSSDFAVVRYTASGALDTSFSSDGMQTISFGLDESGTVDVCRTLALQTDGKILLGGYTENINDDYDFGIVRLNSDGNLDSSFSDDGKLALDLSEGNYDEAYAMAMQADGKVVIAGDAEEAFGLVRLNLITRSDVRVGSNVSAKKGDNIYNTSASGQTKSTRIKKSGGKKTLYVMVQNDGHEADSFTVRARKGNSKFKVQYLDGKTDVTNAVKSGTFSTGIMAPGATFLLKVKITAKTDKKRKKISLNVVTKSTTDSTSKDKVKIKAASK